jgi:hypothetical protein
MNGDDGQSFDFKGTPKTHRHRHSIEHHTDLFVAMFFRRTFLTLDSFRVRFLKIMRHASSM